MTRKILTIAILTVLFINACKKTQKQETAETTLIESVKEVDDDIVKSSSTDKDGKKLEMTFNNTKGTATINFNGETIKLVAQKAASGIWYKNANYELRGKGNDVELTKDGKTVFKK